MCGIGFLLGACQANQSELRCCIRSLRRRGPDAGRHITVDLQGGRTLHLMAAVLHLRGDELFKQPAEDVHGNVLLWNGEVFDGLDVGPSGSDTAAILHALSLSRSHQEVVAALGRISGPFSLVYWCPARQALYYGRDPVGRRSLVVRRPRAPEEFMAVLSCLPETSGSPADSDADADFDADADASAGEAQPRPQAMPPPDPVVGGDCNPSLDRKNDRELLPNLLGDTPVSPEAAGAGCRSGEGRWEEVRADGIYVLELGKESAADEGDGNGGSDHGDSSTTTTGTTAVAAASFSPAKLYSYPRRPLLRSAGAGVAEAEGAEEAKGEEGEEEEAKAPAPAEAAERCKSGRRRRAGCAEDYAATDRGQAGSEEGAEKEEEGCMNSKAGRLLGTRECQEGGSKRASAKARVRFNDGLKISTHHLSPAAKGLLNKLRESVRRRVRTVPYSALSGNNACCGGRAGRRRGRDDGGGGDDGGDGTERRNEPGYRFDIGQEDARLDVGDGVSRLRGAGAARASGDIDAGLQAAAGAEEERRSLRGGRGLVTAVTPTAAVAARVGVLFSGGLDSVVLAAMLAEERDGGASAVPRGEGIDLINVCFDSPSGHRSPDRLASIAAADELRSLFHWHTWRLVCVDASYDDVLRHSGAIWRVMQPCSTTMDFNIAAAFWFAARGTGWLYQPPAPAPRETPPFPASACSPTRDRRDLVDGTVTAGISITLHGSADYDDSEEWEAVPSGPSASASTVVDVPRASHGALTAPAGGVVVAAVAEAAPFLHPAASAVTTAAAVGVSSGESGAPALGVPGGAGDLLAVSPISPVSSASAPKDAPRNGTAAAAAASSATSGSRNGKVVAKVNKNSDELCPVDGCRRLLKPGCVFGTCSRCCLKAQGILDAAAAAGVAATIGASASVRKGGLQPESEADREGIASVTAQEVQDAATAPTARERQQRECKARAQAAALRALEAHLLDHFEADLSPPFRAEALAALLLWLPPPPQAPPRPQQTQSVLPLRRKAADGVPATERDGCRRSLLANASPGARQTPTECCPIHKRPRKREQGGSTGGVGCGGGEAGVSPNGTGPEAGDENRAAGRRPAASEGVFTSAARVLLVGIGADEFMGGYSRHRNAFNRGGDDSLAEELAQDQARLWTRNLGRDDRSIADHGREARFPFLDEGVIDYIRSLPLRDVCDMDDPPGVGDKKILREVASHLGLDGCRSLPKRAIQFGSRIAQHCARHTHGSHRRGSGSAPAASPL